MEHVTLSPSRLLKHKFVARKLNDLLDILFELKEGLEKIADSVSDSQLRKTISGVALESNQYATEIISKIQSLGGKPHHVSLHRKYSIIAFEKLNTEQSAHSEPDALKMCYSSENSIVKAYRDFLNEYTPYEDVRTLVRTQLNGMLCAFVQLKLFNITLRTYASNNQ